MQSFQRKTRPVVVARVRRIRHVSGPKTVRQVAPQPDLSGLVLYGQA